MNVNITKNEKRDLISRVVTLSLLFIVLLFAVMYVISLNSSLGWFSSGGTLRSEGMQVAIATETYDILVDRTHEYDTLISENELKYDDMDVFESTITASEYGYDLTATSLRLSNGLAFELQNEVAYHDAGVEYRFLMPGACGSMTFYLRPLNDEPLTVNFTLDIDYFKKVYENGSVTVRQESDPYVEDLLKGHLLMFTERRGNSPDNYQYNGLLDTGSFTYNTADHSKCTKPGYTDCYEITIYWEWPPLYSELANNISDTAWGAKYPAALATYIDQHRSYFFAGNLSTNDLEDLIDEYNDADQTIGEHANFVTVIIDCD